MATPPAMKALYSRLTGAGMPTNYVRNVVLPEWWDDNVASDDAGLAQAQLIISRHLGVDYDSLADASQPIRLADCGTFKFKKSQNLADEDVQVARSIAMRAASLAALGAVPEFSGVPSASDVRQFILGSGQRWIGLKEIVDYCWACGIPVLHISRFPRSTKKMDGMAIMVNERPVIVVCKNSKYTPWLSFIVAHELGHIASKHLGNNSVLIDEKVSTSDHDAEEQAANDYAIDLIAGSKRYVPGSHWLKAAALANEAQVAGARDNVDPGHVVLNYAHMSGKFFAVANAALQILEPNTNPKALISESLAGNLDWSMLPPESCEFLVKVTGDHSNAPC